MDDNQQAQRIPGDVRAMICQGVCFRVNDYNATRPITIRPGRFSFCDDPSMPNVFIPPPLRDLTDGLEQIELEGTTVRQIVAALESRYPGTRERLCVDETLRPGLAVAINGAVSSLGLLQKVPEKGEVHFLPAIGGG
jgi:molybdopterin converting factor small subunit